MSAKRGYDDVSGSAWVWPSGGVCSAAGGFESLVCVMLEFKVWLSYTMRGGLERV